MPTYKRKYKDIINHEIKGHQIRTRGQPRFEINEPNVDYYFKLEQRARQKSIITNLQDEDGKILTENKDMIKLAERYYTTLYSPSKTDMLK